jgi:phosphate transport system permease protein
LTDISLSQPADLTDRSQGTRRAGAGDTRFRLLALSAAILVLLIFAGVIGALIHGSMPAFKAYGFGFLTEEAWRPSREIFGAVGPIYGTLVTSAIAMIIALPASPSS